MILILILRLLYTLLVLEFDILLRTFISIFFVATRHARCAVLHHHVHETCHLQQGSVKCHVQQGSVKCHVQQGSVKVQQASVKVCKVASRCVERQGVWSRE